MKRTGWILRSCIRFDKDCSSTPLTNLLTPLKANHRSLSEAEGLPPQHAVPFPIGFTQPFQKITKLRCRYRS